MQSRFLSKRPWAACLLVMVAGCGTDSAPDTAAAPGHVTVVYGDGRREVRPLLDVFGDEAPEPKPTGIVAVDRRTRREVVISPAEAARQHPTTGRYVIVMQSPKSPRNASSDSVR